MKFIKAAAIILAAGSSAYSMMFIQEMNQMRISSPKLSEFLSSEIYPDCNFEVLKNKLIGAKENGKINEFLQSLLADEILCLMVNGINLTAPKHQKVRENMRRKPEKSCNYKLSNKAKRKSRRALH